MIYIYIYIYVVGLERDLVTSSLTKTENRMLIDLGYRVYQGDPIRESIFAEGLRNIDRTCPDTRL